MGLGGISLGQLLLIFLIATLVFGSKRLRHLGEDLGAALRSFRQGLKESTKEISEEVIDEQKK
jgi:sec-independent protein translocase protein TatA